MRALLIELTYRRPFAWLVLWPALAFGVVWFRATGRTPWLSYWAMRRLYCVTRGASNRWLTRRLARFPTAAPRVGAGLIADRSTKHIDDLVEVLRRDGFVVIGPALSAQQTASLVDFALATPARLIPAPASGPEKDRFEPQRPRAIKYDFAEEQLIEHPVVQALLADASLRDLARRYLGCEPINDLVAMWWSTAFSHEANSDVAQLYHFDMDRPQFLKLFFYLTDVTEDTGPHCFIRGSHRERPAALWRDGRHSDEEVLQAYGRESEARICAPAGTLIAVDTSGFHKGMPLARGHRLILQLEFTSTLFGAPYARPHLPVTEFWRSEVAAARGYYARFRLA